MTLLAIVAIHTAENEPLKIWVWFHSFFIRLLTVQPAVQLPAQLPVQLAAREARLWEAVRTASCAASGLARGADERARGARSAATLRWILFITWRTLGGSFAAVWIATIASKVTFYSIFQALQDKQTFAPFTFQNFSEKTSKFLPEWKWNFIFHSRFSLNFAIFRRNFDENLPEFHRNCQEMTKCIEILRKSATNIPKMLEISGICEKLSFFISFFHSCP